MNSFLMWIGSLLILVLAALFFGPHFVDWNGYRGVFEEEASRILGRDVRVGGNVNLRLLPAPYVRFEQLQVADTTGIAGAPLFHADSFTMWLSVPPLLKGILEAKKIELERPSVALAIDEEGFGNWRSLSRGYGSLPFVPSGVELQSVQITDGLIAVSLQRGGEIARLENINGELAAKKLAGPYSFRGSLEMNGAKRDVRLTTTEPDETGAVRLNGQILAPVSNDKFTVDVRLSDLWNQPHIEGELGGRIRLTAIGEDAFAELKAKLQAGPETAELTEITASLENSGQPQMLAGQLSAQWGARQRVDLSLSSRWLDLDRFAGSKAPAGSGGSADAATDAAVSAPHERAGPLQIARSLLVSLTGLFPENVDVRADFTVDQVSMGGEAVSDVSLIMQREGGPFELPTLRAILPGGARLDFSGRVENDAGAPVFSGDLYIGGASAARAISWALGPDGASAINSDGPFAVEGQMRLGRSSLQLTDARAEFSGVPIRGSINWRDDDDKRLELAIEGREIDTRWVGINNFAMPAVVDILSAGGVPETGKPAGPGVLPAWLAGRYGDVTLKVRAGTLRNGTNELRDVTADIALRGGRIEVNKADFETEAGLEVSLEGAIDEPSEAPRGSLRFVVAAEDKAAATALSEALGGEAPRGYFMDRLSDLAPFRLAGRLSLSERLTGAADIDIDGMASGGLIEARLRLDGGIDHWRSRQADILVRVKDGKAARWVANWLGGAEGFETADSSLNGGSGLLKAVGVPREGMLTMATLDGDGLSLIYDGKSGVSENMLSALSGEFVVNAKQANDVLALIGIELAEGAELGPAQGVVEFERRDGSYVFKPRDMIFAGARLAGSIAVSRQHGDGHRLEADLMTDNAYLPGLMSAILARPREGSAAPEATDPGQQSAREQLAHAQQSAEAMLADAAIFSDQPFDLSPLAEFSGRISLKANKLMLHEDMHLDDASLTVSFGGSRAELVLNKAAAFEGEVSGKLSFERAPAGVVATGNVALLGGNLAKLVDQKSGATLASGTVDITGAFSGRGLGPRGLISALTGEGQLTLKDATVNGCDPGIITEATLALITSDEPIKDFAGVLRRDLGKGTLQVGSRKVGLKIVDGAIRFDPVSIETPKGLTEVVTTVDIASMAVDSEWRIKAKSAVEGEDDWPAVSVTFVGPIAQIPAIEPRLTADAVERELTVRRMERNVKELERLRRLDEEAAARERERQRRIEEERARAEAAAAAARAAEEAAAAAQQGVNTTNQAPGAAGGNVTFESLPPVEATPNAGNNAGMTEQQSFEAGQTVTPEAAIKPEGGSASTGTQQPPAPKPARHLPPQQSPSDILLKQLLGAN